MARKSFDLLVAILVTITLLDCLTECGAAKNKGKGKGKARQKQKGKFRQDIPAVIPKCVFAEQVNFICGSNGVVYANAKNLECGKLFYKDLKEADQSTCPKFPKTEEEKKKLEEKWKEAIKEISELGSGTSTIKAPTTGAPNTGAPSTGTSRKKDQNKGNKTTNKNDKNKNEKDDKRKRLNAPPQIL